MGAICCRLQQGKEGLNIPFEGSQSLANTLGVEKTMHLRCVYTSGFPIVFRIIVWVVCCCHETGLNRSCFNFRTQLKTTSRWLGAGLVRTSGLRLTPSTVTMSTSSRRWWTRWRRWLERRTHGPMIWTPNGLVKVKEKKERKDRSNINEIWKMKNVKC